MDDQKIISADVLRAACLEDSYETRLAEPEVFPSESQWKYIIEYRMETLAPRLYRKYLVAWLTPKEEQTEFHRAALENMSPYLNSIPREKALKTVYSDITSSPEATLALIEKSRLFDAPTLSRLTDEGHNGFVAEAVNAFQPDYSPEDLLTMSDLAILLKNPNPLGEIREVRGLFRGEMKFVCPRGHANPVGTEFCTEPGCGMDILGLTEEQHKNVNRYVHRVSILKRLLENQSEK